MPKMEQWLKDYKITRKVNADFGEAYKAGSYYEYFYGDPHAKFAELLGVTRQEAKQIAYKVIYSNKLIKDMLRNSRK